MKLDGVQLAMLRQLRTRSRTIRGGLNSAAMKQLVKLRFQHYGLWAHNEDWERK